MKKVQCPLCLTKMQAHGNELVCPECGYKYCDHSYNSRDIYNTTEHEHDDHITYSKPTTSTVQTTRNSNGRSYRSNTGFPKKSPLVPLIAIALLFIAPIFANPGDKDSDAIANNASEYISESEYADNTVSDSSDYGYFTYGEDTSSKVIEDFIQYCMTETSQSREYVEEQMDVLDITCNPGSVTIYCDFADGESLYFASHDYEDFNKKELAVFSNLTSLSAKNISFKAGDLDNFPYLVELLNSYNTPEQIAEAIDPTQLSYLALDLPEGETTLKGLSAFTELTDFYVYSEVLTDVSEVSSLTKLTDLYLICEDYRGSYDFTKGLDQLSFLCAGMGNCQHYEFLSYVPNLTSLELYDTGLGDLSAISQCPKLETLYLSYMPYIKDYTAITTLSSLDSLQIDSCNLKDISFMEELSNIEWLSLSNNEISDLTPLHALSLLRYVNVEGNPVSSDEINALQAALPNVSLTY